MLIQLVKFEGGDSRMKNKNEENKVKREGLKKKINKKSLTSAILVIVGSGLIATSTLSGKNVEPQSHYDYLVEQISRNIGDDPDALNEAMRSDFEDLVGKALKGCYQEEKGEYDFTDFDDKTLALMWLSCYFPDSLLEEKYNEYYNDEIYIAAMISTYGYSLIQENDSTNRNHDEFLANFWNPDLTISNDWKLEDANMVADDFIRDVSAEIFNDYSSLKVKGKRK